MASIFITQPSDRAELTRHEKLDREVVPGEVSRFPSYSPKNVPAVLRAGFHEKDQQAISW